jgi:hypothetical protein
MADGKLTIDDGKRALSEHAVDKAFEIRERYGDNIDYDGVLKLLQDTDFVRFPTTVTFGSLEDPGLFAITNPISEDPSDGYSIQVSQRYEDRHDLLPALILYHLVTVNYGDFANADDAEKFGAAVLGMPQESYYNLLCSIVDGLFY